MLTPKQTFQPPVQQRNHTHVTVDYDRCFYCGACVAVCLSDALFLNNMILSVDSTTCTRCERCTACCPAHALSLQFKAELLADSECDSASAPTMLKN
ncbi:MAG: 4Fe-4S dicluster domain-containing protein [Anaerolineae bacterium]|nr:4Fe-4S dicluster domain-containing protein [Anaerolineae bacterium]